MPPNMPDSEGKRREAEPRLWRRSRMAPKNQDRFSERIMREIKVLERPLRVQMDARRSMRGLSGGGPASGCRGEFPNAGLDVLQRDRGNAQAHETRGFFGTIEEAVARLDDDAARGRRLGETA